MHLMKARLRGFDDVPVYSCPICGKRFERPRQVTGHVAGKHSFKPRLLPVSINVDGLTPYQVGCLAGYLDAGGGIQVTRTTRESRECTIALHPTVYFTSGNRESLEAMRTLLMTGSMVVAHQKPGYHDTYALHITGMNNIRKLLLRMLPQITIKRRQAEIMLQYCASRMNHISEKDRHYSSAELELYSAMIQANRKGGKITANSREFDKGG
jgi:hypothetical protein